MSRVVSVAAAAAPSAENAHRRLVMRCARSGSWRPDDTNTTARSRARPGSGWYQAGSATAFGSTASRSVTPGGSARASPPPAGDFDASSPMPRTSTLRVVAARARIAVSGSVTTTPTSPSSSARGSTASGVSGDTSTAIAPSRLSAVTADRCDGRDRITTATRAPDCTPDAISPRTTASTRRLASA